MSLADSAESWPAAHFDDLVAWRRHIHRYPELGRQEYATTQFVAERLADAGLNPKVLPGGTGLTCDFGPDHEPRIALRADMDALPMAERTGAPYESTMPNAAHACGHDAHTAILLGMTLALYRARPLPVGWRSIFQPSEETGRGAQEMVAHGALEGVDAVIALHVEGFLRRAAEQSAVTPDIGEEVADIPHDLRPQRTVVGLEHNPLRAAIDRFAQEDQCSAHAEIFQI